MRKILKMLPYLLACELSFLLVPLVGVNTGALIFLLLLFLPLACLTASILCGIFAPPSPMQWLFPLFVSLLFTVTFYAVVQEIVWIYTLGYAGISLLGVGIGVLARRYIRRK